MLGMLVVTAIYILRSFSVLGIIPAAALEKSATPYADAAVIIYGPAARYIVGAGVAIAAFRRIKRLDISAGAGALCYREG